MPGTKIIVHMNYAISIQKHVPTRTRRTFKITHYYNYYSIVNINLQNYINSNLRLGLTLVHLPELDIDVDANVHDDTIVIWDDM